MKEAAISAGALVGLLAFAGIYSHSQNSHRARRNIVVSEEIEEVDTDDFTDHTGEFMTDIANMTADDWHAMQVGLGIQEADLLPFEVEEDDVQSKQRGKRKRGKGGAVNMNRFKLKDVPKLHDKMLETHSFRMNQLLENFVTDGGVVPAERAPVDLLSDDEAASAHVSGGAYPDYEGNDKTAPVVQKFLNEFGYASGGRNVFREGNTQIWFLIPAAVPLFGAASDHLGAYGNYWNFIQSWASALDRSTGRGGNSVRMSVGLYHKGAVYSPRGTLYRSGRFPWGRIKNFYLRPRTTTQMPYIIPTAASLLQWIPRFGASSASAGDDCFTIWFHQDFAADANQLLLEDQFAQVDQLYQLCSVVHIFVGMDKNNANVRAYASALSPGLQTRVAKDPDFSGVFYADTLADVMGEDLREGIFKYMTLIKARAGCRLSDEGYVAPPSEMGGTAFAVTAGGFEATAGAVDATGAAVTGGAEVVEYDSEDYGTEAPTVRGLLDEEPTEPPKVPEIDSCCGHDMFTGTPYDSELRTCCEDGSPQAFSNDGSDPCIGDIGFAFKK